jgi:NADH-ubiquinone oxidoreductase chain 5
MGLELILMILIVYENTDVLLNLGNWINIGNYEINWVFRYDSLTRIMLIPIILVSFLVQLYSSMYLKGDPHITRYYSYLNLFTYQMLLLVTGDNFFTLFLGWEGVGLASYLLVNFWFTRIAANMASLKAFLMNRVGDWG